MSEIIFNTSRSIDSTDVDGLLISIETCDKGIYFHAERYGKGPSEANYVILHDQRQHAAMMFELMAKLIRGS
jgi:hypothetical protein